MNTQNSKYNVKNCSLYTLLTATDRKQRNYKKAILTTVTVSFFAAHSFLVSV